MPQVQLPVFPVGVTHITAELAVQKEDGVVTYLNGTMPVFQHGEDDLRSFRMITAQFCVTGVTSQAQIIRTFDVSKTLVMRAVRRYREKGPQGFFEPRKTRGAAVLTPPVLEQVQALLDQGIEIREAAEQLGLKPNTVKKAVLAGRLHRRARSAHSVADASASAGMENDANPVRSKSERSAIDNVAEMGVGATHTMERVWASLGMGPTEGMEPRFVPACDVTNAGVLLSVPALLAIGLLRHTDKHFTLPKGYYGLPSLLLLLAFMALSRVKTIERLRYDAPGEWGKILGLDRVPEVRTLREKLAHLSEQGTAIAWSAELCQEWMAGAPEQAQVFYVDGHVRVYHGEQTKLPRHYVSRQRLCLRAAVDYWVNAMDGQPFFVVHQDVDPGLVKVLNNEIFPRLVKEVPGQPTADALERDPLLHRFTVIFDREGYSPELLKKAKEQRIACLTYRKKPVADWPEEEFTEHEVTLVSGNVTKMRLAERGVYLGDKVWVREIRRLTASGHQTTIVSTDYRSALPKAAAAMFARWCQENFFRYMREHYGLDHLVEYGTEAIPATTQVVNPVYRRLDGEIRKKAARLSRVRAQFGALSLEGEIEPKKVEAYEHKKAELQTESEHLQEQLAALKAERKSVPRHITFGELPADAKFERLRIHSKHLIDTIKMIAYRAETAMMHVLQETLARQDDARALLCALYNQDADLVPDAVAGTLTIRLHHMASHAQDEAVRHLCEELNATQTQFPGSDLRLVYELVSSQNPRPQEV
jgi:transposase